MQSNGFSKSQKSHLAKKCKNKDFRIIIFKINQIISLFLCSALMAQHQAFTIKIKLTCQLPAKFELNKWFVIGLKSNKEYLKNFMTTPTLSF